MWFKFLQYLSFENWCGIALFRKYSITPWIWAKVLSWFIFFYILRFSLSCSSKFIPNASLIISSSFKCLNPESLMSQSIQSVILSSTIFSSSVTDFAKFAKSWTGNSSSSIQILRKIFLYVVKSYAIILLILISDLTPNH